jgi:hypothetical protein
MSNEISAGPELLNGASIAVAPRQRLIAPACVLGKLRWTFAAAEGLRRLVRGIPDYGLRN